MDLDELQAELEEIDLVAKPMLKSSIIISIGSILVAITILIVAAC